MCNSTVAIGGIAGNGDWSFGRNTSTPFQEQVKKIFSGEPWIDIPIEEEGRLPQRSIADCVEQWNYKCDECGCILIHLVHQIDGKSLCDECYNKLYMERSLTTTSTTPDEDDDSWSYFMRVAKKPAERIAEALEHIAEAADKLASIYRGPEIYTSSHTTDTHN